MGTKLNQIKNRVLSLLLSICMVVLLPLSIIGGVVATNSITAEAAAKVFNVTDHGANPSGVSDSYTAVKETIDEAKQWQQANGNAEVVINFPKGRYDFYPDLIEGKILFPSNTNNGGITGNQGSMNGGTRSATWQTKYIAILIEDMENVTVAGNGSTFMCHGNMTPFASIGSKNVVFKDFISDFYAPLTIDMTVLAVDRTANIVTLKIPENYDVGISGTTLSISSDRSPYSNQIYLTRNINNSNSPLCKQLDLYDGKWVSASNCFANCSRIEQASNEGKNVFKLYINGSIDNSIREGIVYLNRQDPRRTAGTFIWKSNNVTLSGIDYYYMHGFGLVAQQSANLNFLHVTFGPPKGTGRASGGFADFMQISGCGGDVVVDGCVFANPQDDPINMHGTFVDLSVVESDRKNVTVYHTEDAGAQETYGFPNFFPGNKLEFSDHNTTLAYSEQGQLTNEATQGVYHPTVISYEGPDGNGKLCRMTLKPEYYNNGQWVNKDYDPYSHDIYDVVDLGSAPLGRNDKTYNMKLTLDAPVPEGVRVGHNNTSAENLTYIPNITIKNSIFKEAGPRGILLKARGHIEVFNNEFDGIVRHAIMVENPNANWRESGRILDLDIYNNVFKRGSNESDSTQIINIQGSGDGTHKNIRIRDNFFYLGGSGAQNNRPYPILTASGTHGITVRNNSIIWLESNIASSFTQTERTLSLDASENIGITRNGTSVSTGETVLQITGKTAPGSNNVLFNFSNCKNEVVENNIYDDGINAKVSGISGTGTVSGDEAIVGDNLLPLGRNILYRVDKLSGDGDVITVSKTGQVKAVSPGSATVTAVIVSAGKSYESTNKVTYTVTEERVEGAISSITGDLSKSLVPGGESASFSATTRDYNGEATEGSLSWSIQNAKNDASTSASLSTQSTNGSTHTNTISSNNNATAIVRASAQNGVSLSKIVSIQGSNREVLLADGLSFESENVSNRTINEDGSISIKAMGQDLYQSSNSPQNLLKIPQSALPESVDLVNGNWEAELEIQGMGMAWAAAGLLLYKDNNNYYGMLRKIRDNTNKVWMGLFPETNGTMNENVKSEYTNNAVGANITVKIKKEGNNLIGYFKNGEADWTQLNTISNVTLSDQHQFAILAGGGKNTAMVFKNFKLNSEAFPLVKVLDDTSPYHKANSINAAATESVLNATVNYPNSMSAGDFSDTIIRWAVSDNAANGNGSAPVNYNIILGSSAIGDSLTLDDASYVGKYITPCVVLETAGKPGDIVWGNSTLIESVINPLDNIKSSDASIYGTPSLNIINGGEETDITQTMISKGTPGYNPANYAYQYRVTDSSVTGFNFEFLADKDATVSISWADKGIEVEPIEEEHDGKTYKKYSGNLDVYNGANTLYISILAQDGKTRKEYRFTIERKGDNDKRLASVFVDENEIEIRDGVYAYEVALADENATSATVSVTANSPHAIIKMSTQSPSAGASGIESVGSNDTGKGTVTGQVSLRPGDHAIYIVCTPETGDSPAVYTINLKTKNDADANLSSMSLIADAADANLYIDQNFNKNITEYNGRISRPGAKLSVAATYQDSVIKVYLNDESTPISTFNGNGGIASIKFRENANVLRIEVTAPDGQAKKTYTVNIDGQAYVYLADYKPSGPSQTTNVNTGTNFNKWATSGNNATLWIASENPQDTNDQRKAYDNVMISHPGSNSSQDFMLTFNDMQGFTGIEATVGISGGLSPMKTGQGDTNATVKILADGAALSGAGPQTVYRNSVKKSSGPQVLRASFNNVSSISLVGNSAGNGNGQWIGWANVKLFRPFDDNVSDETNANLKSFSILPEAGGDAYLTMTPNFSQTQTQYAGSIAKANARIQVATADERAKVEIRVNGEVVQSDITGTAISDLFKFKLGNNDIEIEVTSVDGTTKTYSMTVEGRDYVYLTDVFPSATGASGNYNGFPTYNSAQSGAALGVVNESNGTSITTSTRQKGLVMHPANVSSTAELRYNIAGKDFIAFESEVGVAANMSGSNEKPNLRFYVKTNGQEATLMDGDTYKEASLDRAANYSSGPKMLRVDLSGKNELTLCVTKGSGKEDNSSQHGAWTNPKLYRKFDDESFVIMDLIADESMGEATIDGEKFTKIDEDTESIVIKEYEAGTEVELKATPKPGYAFKGWKIGNRTILIEGATYNYEINSDSIITAVFDREYTVSFVLSQGDSTTPNPENQVVINGGFAQEPDEPVSARADYIFDGWWTTPDSSDSPGVHWIFDDHPITQDTTLYARWAESTEENPHQHSEFTVEFNLMGGHMDYHTVHAGHYIGSLITQPDPAPEYTGYTFAGWYLDKSYTTPWDFDTDTIDEDHCDEENGHRVILYAKWVTKLLKVVFDYQDDTTPDKEIFVDYGTHILAPQTPQRDNFVFAGWYTDDLYNTRWNFYERDIITRDMTLYAKWDEVQEEEGKHTVIFDAENGTTNTVVYVDHEGYVERPADPEKSGYEFIGWYADSDIDELWDFDTDIITKPTTFRAKWKQKPDPGTGDGGETGGDQGGTEDGGETGGGDQGGEETPPSPPSRPSRPSTPSRPSSTTTTVTPAPAPTPTNSALSNSGTGATMGVNVVATNGNATVSGITASGLNAITTSIGRAVKSIDINVSTGNTGAGAVKSVTLIKPEASQIASVLTNTSNMEDYLNLKTDNASVKIDGAALSTIASTASANEIQIVVDNVVETSLNNGARLAVASINAQVGKQVEQTFEAYVTSGGRRISSFGNGTVTVGKLDFKIPAGRNPKHYHVYYLDNNGVAIKHPSWYENGAIYFNTNHFSEYAVVYDTTEENGVSDEVFKLYNKATNETLLTTTVLEVTELTKQGWVNQGSIGRSLTNGQAVYRVFNPQSGEHLYTAERYEVLVLTTQYGWNLEYGGKPMYYVSKTANPGNGATTAVYRGFNAKKGAVASHSYAIEQTGSNQLTKNGYALDNNGAPVYYLAK